MLKKIFTVSFSLLLFQLPLPMLAQEARTVTNIDSLRELLSTADNIHDRADLNLKMCQALVEKDSSGASYCDIALSLYKQNVEVEDRSDKIHLLLSAYQSVQGNYDSALTLGKKALRLAKINQNLKLQPEVLLSIGNNFARRAVFDSAYSYYIQALQLYDSMGIRSSSIYLSLANANTSSRGDLSLSLKYLKMAEKISKEDALTDKLGRIYFNSAVVFIRMKYSDTVSASHQDSAIYYLQQSADFYRENDPNNQRMIGANYRLMGSIYLDQGKLALAELNLLKAIDHLTKINYLRGLSETYDHMGSLKVQQGEYTQAKEWVAKAIKIHRQTNMVQRERYSLGTLHDINILEGDYKTALSNFKRQVELKDSIYSVEKRIRTEELQVKHETELQEAENRILKKETELKTQVIQNQNSIVIASIIVALVVLVAAALVLRQSHARKKLLTQIEKQAAKLRALDQAKSRFFANISHDLRSPLTLILNAFDQVTDSDYEVLEQKSKIALDNGYKNSKRLLHLADEIMELTRLEDGKVTPKSEPVQIIPFANTLTKMFSSAVEIKGINLTFGYEHLTSDTSVYLDTSHFERIFYNILSNSLKFTPRDGQIDVAISSLGESNLMLAISDTGPGIPEEEIAYIFDRYYQANNKYTSQAGVGIGLALVKELVELNKGTISVQSGKSGTTFTIQFPIHRLSTITENPDISLDIITRNSLWSDLQGDQDQLQIPTLSNQNDVYTVLIVEDHFELRSYIKGLLAEHYKICLASNGREALKVLDQHHPDLIITDLMMPYMDGFEFINHLKTDKTLAKIPVLVLSARTDQSEKLSVLAKGAEVVLNKPFDRKELLVQINNLINKRNEWNAEKKFASIYENSRVDEYEKNILIQLERLVVDRIDDSHLSVLDLADKMAASESKAYRMIKKLTGLSPSEYIKEIRLQYIHDYIEKNDIASVTEAARMIGINNATYFNKMYSERFGRSVKEVISH